MSQAPTVSICLPIYNGERFLARAVQSALNQSYKDFELLIIDDCSKDSSPQLVEQFATIDKRVRFLKNEQNLGLFNNYNECIKKASGRYLKLFAQDDIFQPTILEKMVRVLEDKPNVALVGCAKGWISETDEPIAPTNENALRTLKPFDEDVCKSAHEVMLDSFQRTVNWIGEPCAVMFRKAHSGSGFDVRLKQIGDLEYWYRILENGDYFYLSEELCKFRKHSASTTNRNGRSLTALLDWFVLGSKYRHLISELNETEDEFCQRLTRRLIKTVSSRFAGDAKKKVDSAIVLEQLTDFDSILSSFATVDGAPRNEETEYKAFAICALREGAGLVSEIRTTQSQVEIQQGQIEELKSELAEVQGALESEVAELRATLSDLGRSMSWKVTAPLRSLKKILR